MLQFSFIVPNITSKIIDHVWFNETINDFWITVNGLIKLVNGQTLSVNIHNQRRLVPSQTPTSIPTTLSSDVPTTEPTNIPSENPTTSPTGVPTLTPSDNPTSIPTGIPTSTPTSTPSKQPSVQPTKYPTKETTTTVFRNTNIGNNRERDRNNGDSVGTAVTILTVFCPLLFCCVCCLIVFIFYKRKKDKKEDEKRRGKYTTPSGAVIDFDGNDEDNDDNDDADDDDSDHNGKAKGTGEISTNNDAIYHAWGT